MELLHLSRNILMTLACLFSQIGAECNFETKCPWRASRIKGRGFFPTNGDRIDLSCTYCPRVDHSTASSKGNYLMLVDSELRATYTSPWYGSSGPQCKLQFYLQMKGVTVGTLRVRLITHNSNISRDIWEKLDEQHSTGWGLNEIALGEISEPFRLQFVGIRGIGEQAFMALDSISLPNCDPDLPSSNHTCSMAEFRCGGTGKCINRDKVCDLEQQCLYGGDESPELCGDLPASASCSFEDGMCGWKHVTADSDEKDQRQFNWTRHQGKTPSEKTGPSFDHTYGNETGYYMYIETSDQKMGAIAQLETPRFPPPPKEATHPDSYYSRSCQVRFYYHMFGKHTAALEVFVHTNLDNTERKTYRQIFRKYGINEDHWYRATVPIPAMSSSYVLRFVAKRGMRYTGDIAIDDMSLSPECFGEGLLKNKTVTRSDPIDPHTTQPRMTQTTTRRLTTQVTSQPPDIYINNKMVPYSERISFKNNPEYLFKTCGIEKGPKGPTQSDCDSFYQLSLKYPIKVKVSTRPKLAGIQIWTVPENGTYGITALGAHGGKGVRNQKKSEGGYATAHFKLIKGELLYILVGQAGESPCSESQDRDSDLCRTNWSDIEDGERMSEIYGGGGGGGGASYVFKRDSVTKKLVPLIIAAGAGGKSYRNSNDSIDGCTHGGYLPLNSGNMGHGNWSEESKAGPGGGWNISSPNLSAVAGHSLIMGGLGGKSCPEAQKPLKAAGGFGGGGGACRSGGGGGGFSGGAVSFTDDYMENGCGGVSFINPIGTRAYSAPKNNREHGMVAVMNIFIDCPCQYMCEQTVEAPGYICSCRKKQRLADDGLSCITPVATKIDKGIPLGAIIAVILASVVTLMFIATIIICFVHKRNQKRLKAVRIEMLSGTNPDTQLTRLRNETGGITEYNPNYDFCGTNCGVQDLREIARDKLTLVKALGQGAFGEVYQGYLSSVPREPVDLPVAVKTLPALCTDQAEMDFLMEALIMSKFNHPNIVRLIGVCFEKHPRFIILELLEGGDVKTFLRASRPKPELPSPLSMPDLLRLSVDIAKGCKYLEENHFIHRDIAARNCLLTTKGPNRIAKIADFGMARDIYRADYYRKGGKAMLPVKWMPPEAFLDGVFTSKTDVWSFGILLWEVFSLGYMPYPGRGNQEVMEFVTTGGRLEAPDNCPAPVFQIMNQCWSSSAEHRPTFAQIIEKIGYCAQDPDVIDTTLPIFIRPPSVEKDATVMRPREWDHVLQVHSPHQSPEEDRKGNLSDSQESLDKLLPGEPRVTKNTDTEESSPKRSSLIRVSPEKIVNEHEVETLLGCSQPQQQEVTTPKSALNIESQNVNPGTGSEGSDNVFTSSMSDLSSSNSSRTSMPQSPPSLPSIARSRPSPKRPVSQELSIRSLDSAVLSLSSKDLNKADRSNSSLNLSSHSSCNSVDKSTQPSEPHSDARHRGNIIWPQDPNRKNNVFSKVPDNRKEERADSGVVPDMGDISPRQMNSWC
ncbi:unnamed protein product [Owenia fusiformis]|uniref:Tyrosine-protein kinase receptor n=1 Tax=Owenia fusiformis TaxID=6347 RepID=A0A8S4P9V4_OWEFU|nr:unnamed protein product [Owenia fusiformis]